MTEVRGISRVREIEREGGVREEIRGGRGPKT